MLKSMSKFSVIIAVAVLAVYAYADEPTKTCPAGGCPAAKPTTACGKDCPTCPSTTATSQDAAKTCAGGEVCRNGVRQGLQACPSTTATSQDAAKTCATEKCAGTACGKDCKTCPSTIATSQDAAKTCAAGKCEGTACGKDCKTCPSTTATSQDAAKTCAAGKCEGTACGKDCQTCPSSTTAKATSADGCPAGGCGTACGAACGKDCKDCPITAAMNQLPKMTFTVGEEKTCCPTTAAELAKKAGSAIHYCVADKTYEDESAAKLALVEATEKFVADFSEPKVCKDSGTVTIAGKQLCCEQAAAQTQQVVKTAMEKVQLTYLVGEKACSCPIEAKQLATTSGEPTVFVVGEEKTCCDVTARLNLARAKYKAAVIALMQADKVAQEVSTSEFRLVSLNVPNMT